MHAYTTIRGAVEVPKAIVWVGCPDAWAYSDKCIY